MCIEYKRSNLIDIFLHPDIRLLDESIKYLIDLLPDVNLLYKFIQPNNVNLYNILRIARINKKLELANDVICVYYDSFSKEKLSSNKAYAKLVYECIDYGYMNKYSVLCRAIEFHKNDIAFYILKDLPEIPLIALFESIVSSNYEMIEYLRNQKCVGILDEPPERIKDRYHIEDYHMLHNLGFTVPENILNKKLLRSYFTPGSTDIECKYVFDKYNIENIDDQISVLDFVKNVIQKYDVCANYLKYSKKCILKALEWKNYELLYILLNYEQILPDLSIMIQHKNHILLSDQVNLVKKLDLTYNKLFQEQDILFAKENKCDKVTEYFDYITLCKNTSYIKCLEEDLKEIFKTKLEYKHISTYDDLMYLAKIQYSKFYNFYEQHPELRCKKPTENNQQIIKQILSIAVDNDDLDIYAIVFNRLDFDVQKIYVKILNLKPNIKKYMYDHHFMHYWDPKNIYDMHRFTNFLLISDGSYCLRYTT